MPGSSGGRRRDSWQRLPARSVGLVLAAVGFALPWVVRFEGLSDPGHRLLGIFLAAVVLWVFEAIPLHATALGIIAAEVLLVSADGIAVPEPDTALPAADYYAALANPVVILFLGGFVIAELASKYRLDRWLAARLLPPFGDRPSRIVLGLMVITATLSMFMSNTATTATMLAIVVPVLSTLSPGDRLRAGMALAVPVAANVGGMGTPVGTPPNAIAIGALDAAGVGVSFIEWMAMLVPLMLLVLAFAWVLLVRLFPTDQPRVTLRIEADLDRSRAGTIAIVVTAATVVLWLSESLHGVSSSLVALGAVVVVAATGVFTVDDAKRLQWHVLWLVGGGIALGTGVAATGLDAWLIDLVAWDAFPRAGLVLALVGVALGASTVMSNSAVANLLVPIGITLASSPAVALSPLLAGTLIAVGCSLAMALPVSTPPNSVAYATGAIRTKDLARVGLPVGLAGAALIAVVGPLWWDLLGMLPE